MSKNKELLLDVAMAVRGAAPGYEDELDLLPDEVEGLWRALEKSWSEASDYRRALEDIIDAADDSKDGALWWYRNIVEGRVFRKIKKAKRLLNEREDDYAV